MKRISELENVIHLQGERIQALTDNITDLRVQLQVPQAPQATCESVGLNQVPISARRY